MFTRTEIEDLSAQVNDLQDIRILLTAIIHSTQDAISVADEEGLGILINPAYTRLTGLTAEDVIGKPPTVDIAEGEESLKPHPRVAQPQKGYRK